MTSTHANCVVSRKSKTSVTLVSTRHCRAAKSWRAARVTRSWRSCKITVTFGQCGATRRATRKINWPSARAEIHNSARPPHGVPEDRAGHYLNVQHAYVDAQKITPRTNGTRIIRRQSVQPFGLQTARKIHVVISSNSRRRRSCTCNARVNSTECFAHVAIVAGPPRRTQSTCMVRRCGARGSSSSAQPIRDFDCPKIVANATQRGYAGTGY
jgi:hypothetical protein